MADRLRVDLDALHDTAANLDILHDEFASASDIGDGVKDAVGARQLHDAIGTFTGNWKRHREGMVSLLEATAQMARDSHDSYVEADRELANALTEE